MTAHSAPGVQLRLSLWQERTPDLTEYDILLANSSGGKDSSAMLAVLVEQAETAGVHDRIVVALADLGRMEWPGTKEIARAHAEHYGLPFEVVTRTVTDRRTGLPRRQDLVEQAARRYCTSAHKRGPILTLVTRLVAARRQAGGRTPFARPTSWASARTSLPRARSSGGGDSTSAPPMAAGELRCGCRSTTGRRPRCGHGSTERTFRSTPPTRTTGCRG